ncbi:MAG TPA: hypothetical protein VH744_04295, partial [Terriglobales bacterium]
SRKGRGTFLATCQYESEASIVPYMPREDRALALLLLAGVLILLLGCGRQPAGRVDEPEKQGRPPFDESSEANGASPTGDLEPMAIPAGTAVSVHLDKALSSATARVGDSFAAVLDQPLILHGRTIAARGTKLSGEILAAKASSDSADPGYMRLTLKQMSLESRWIPIRTSSIFMKAALRDRRQTTVLDPTSGSAPIGGLQTGTLVGTAAASSGAIIGIDLGARNDVEFGIARKLTFRLVDNAPISR